MQEIRVLFLCRGNRCRSPLAEAMANSLPRRDCHIKASSAGLAPKSVNPLVAEVLGEIGVQASALKSRHVRDFLQERFDFVITLCAEADETCPAVLGHRNITIGLPDPCRTPKLPVSGDQLERFRRVRDALRAMLVAWFGPES